MFIIWDDNIESSIEHHCFNLFENLELHALWLMSYLGTQTEL